MCEDILPAAISAVSETDLPAILGVDTYDALVVVGPGPLSSARLPEKAKQAIARCEALDAKLTRPRSLAMHLAEGICGGRLVLCTTRNLAAGEVFARQIAQAAQKAMKRAISSGAKAPLLVIRMPETDSRFVHSLEVGTMGALAALWQPLETRNQGRHKVPVERIGVVAPAGIGGEAAVARAVALEKGRIAARDVTGTEPEQMSPIKLAEYCLKIFEGSKVKCTVQDELESIEKGYPLLSAVARASRVVERHHPRIVRLEYTGEGEISRSVFLAGKGVTFDTGGADLKTDGHMAGMSRDKGGAGAVVGLFKALAELAPPGIRVVGLVGAVRNSIGAESFTCDEVIVGRSGVRVRIGNTDAEGRLVLADLLAELAEEAKTAPRPLVSSIATLTGHAALAWGPYTAWLENAESRKRGLGEKLARVGEEWGDPVENSRMRPEDYDFCGGYSSAEDVLSCNSAPSSRTPRGHQFPGAFLDITSGLRAHALDPKSKTPIAFAHIDIAGSGIEAGSWQTGTPTGAPVVALLAGLELLSGN